MTDPELLSAAAEHLKAWQHAGVRRVRVAAPAATGAEPSAPPAAPPSGMVREARTEYAAPEAAEAAPGKPASAPVAPAHGQGADTLPGIANELEGCMRCTLGAGRTHIVFGVGDPNARLVFVGEAPGRDEDAQGVPFVGRAGQLLTDIIEKGMKIPRASVYICNTVKCRPPENRNPAPDELAACEPYLARQLAAIRPQVIVAMGKFAAQALCKSDVPISRLRGVWHTYEGIRLMPTYHPAYLLRNPSAKREVWEDIRKVMVELGMDAEGGR
ncbi:MAG: uracil-DNA glycosylase [Nitrospirota bacterium]|nr:uracil-DNA glycosylase [Nitrospirota bacterium]